MLYDISLDEAKLFAKRLSSFIKQTDTDFKHSQALEAVASMLGYRNFNTLHAAFSEPQQNLEAIESEESDIFIRFFTHVFNANHNIPTTPNPQCIYLSAYTESHLETLEDRTIGALSTFDREFTVVDARNQSQLSICEIATGMSFSTFNYAFKALREKLSDTNSIIVFKGISQAKINKKDLFVRGLIKVLDDAHIHGRNQDGDIIFIDYSSFLERNWKLIGIYLSILTTGYPIGLS